MARPPAALCNLATASANNWKAWSPAFSRGSAWARSIRGEMENLRARNGGELSDMDRARLQQRLDALGRSIHWMRENGPGPGPVVGAPPPMAGGEWTLERREAWMQDRLNHARTDGSLSRHDVRRAQATLNGILERQHRMMRDGRLDGRERMELQARLDQLRDTLRWAHQEDAPPWRR